MATITDACSEVLAAGPATTETKADEVVAPASAPKDEVSYKFPSVRRQLTLSLRSLHETSRRLVDYLPGSHLSCIRWAVSVMALPPLPRIRRTRRLPPRRSPRLMPIPNQLPFRTKLPSSTSPSQPSLSRLRPRRCVLFPLD